MPSHRSSRAETRLLTRGDLALPGDVMTPGGIQALARSRGPFHRRSHAPRSAGVASSSPTGSPSPHNPLFARVIVNRLWHYHFGVGLVETPSDFGFNGGRPSHPELLDWLANELIARDFRIKDIHRLIVTSATYRQSVAAAG